MTFTEEWNATYKESPSDLSDQSAGAVVIQKTTKSTRERIMSEHTMGLSDGENQGYHSLACTRVTGSLTLTVEKTFIEAYTTTADINLTLPALSSIFKTSTVKIFYISHYSASNTRVVNLVAAAGDEFDDSKTTYKLGGRESTCMLMSSYANTWSIIQKVPSGAIMMWYAGLSTIPAGWVEHTALKQRFPVGYDSADSDFDTIAKTGGDKKVNLNVSHLPSHRHTMKSTGANASTTGSKGKYEGGTIITEEVGSDNNHENRPPYAVYIYIRKV